MLWIDSNWSKLFYYFFLYFNIPIFLIIIVCVCEDFRNIKNTKERFFIDN